MSSGTRRTAHRLSMLRDSAPWPYLDGLTVYSERVSGDDSNHVLRTSIVANGALGSTRSRRLFDAAGHRAEFRQLDVDAPFLALGGAGDIHRADGQCVVTLSREYELDDDAEEPAERVTRYIDEFSRRELEAPRLSSERLSQLLQQYSAVREA